MRSTGDSRRETRPPGREPGYRNERRPPGRPGIRNERGDVPGWVLVTLMTAGLVMALWAIAGPALTDFFQRAITPHG